MFHFFAMTPGQCCRWFLRLPLPRKYPLAIAAAVVLLAQAVCLPAAPAESSNRPNVVLIMTDDQGYGDLGVHGNPVIETPNIDAMAGRSASVERFYVSPVCAPTRACLMTGRYNYRTRAIDTYIGRAMMEPAEVTIAELIAQAGYATGIFGKWHLGDNYPMRPMDQGFTESLVHRGGGIGQPSDPPGGEGRYTDPILFHNGEQRQMEGYCTDIYFSSAMDWMEKQHEREQPFFVYLPTNAPHGPYHDVPPKWYEHYRDKKLGNDQFPQDKGHPLPEKANTDQRARIFAMISNIDENVGRLLDRLDKLGITDNTIVIFMCDNGPNGRRYVAGMQGNKSHVYEGGIRSPFYIQWPARLEAGHTVKQIAAHIDILPTLLAACGAKQPDDLHLDGRNILPLLAGEQVEWPERYIFIQSHRGNEPVKYHHFAVIGQRWKLVHPSGFGRESLSGPPRFELYDLKNDPYEEQNVAGEYPEKVAELKQAYEQWLADVSSTRPDNYAPSRIYIGTEHENPVTLTRQDWRHIQGRPWAADSIGYWLLHVAEAGKYDVHLRFRSKPYDEKLRLVLGDQAIEQRVPQGSTTAVVKDIQLAEGDTRLKAVLSHEDQSRGPFQVDVLAQ